MIFTASVATTSCSQSSESD